MKSKIRTRWHLIGSMLGLILLAAVNQWAWAAGPQTRGPERIGHIVIIYLENRSFDNLYGHFPGANGLQDASKTATQTDAQGQVYATFPPVMSDRVKPPEPDKRFPANLPNAPFLMDRSTRSMRMTWCAATIGSNSRSMAERWTALSPFPARG